MSDDHTLDAVKEEGIEEQEIEEGSGRFSFKVYPFCTSDGTSPVLDEVIDFVRLNWASLIS